MISIIANGLRTYHIKKKSTVVLWIPWLPSLGSGCQEEAGRGTNYTPSPSLMMVSSPWQPRPDLAGGEKCQPGNLLQKHVCVVKCISKSKTKVIARTEGCYSPEVGNACR